MQNLTAKITALIGFFGMLLSTKVYYEYPNDAIIPLAVMVWVSSVFLMALSMYLISETNKTNKR